MIPSRLLTRGLYPMGKGRGLLTRGLAAVPSSITINGLTSYVVSPTTVAALDQMSSWNAMDADGHLVSLCTTAGVGDLSSPRMLSIINQTHQRRTGHGMKSDSFVRVRWSRDDGSGSEEAVFTWH